jgi:hypothetical protein
MIDRKILNRRRTGKHLLMLQYTEISSITSIPSIVLNLAMLKAIISKHKGSKPMARMKNLVRRVFMAV